MATNKDFVVKNGIAIGGPTATVGGMTIFTGATVPLKENVRCATTTDLNPASFSGGVMTGKAASGTVAMTTTASSTSATLSAADVSKLTLGATLTSANLQASTTVSAINSATTITLSKTASTTATLASTSFTQTIAALTMDGVTPVLNNRILVKDQLNANQNGIYFLSTLGTTSVAWVLSRSGDANTTAECTAAQVAVNEGTVAGGVTFSTGFKSTDTLDTTNMFWYPLAKQSTIPNFDQVWTSNNGNGTNYRVGDDAWIGDINTANTMMVKGVADGTKGAIKLGSSGPTLGFDGVDFNTNWTGFWLGKGAGSATVLEIGSTSLVTTSNIDMHSSGTTADYDVRMECSGGNATSGSGNFRMYANSATLPYVTTRGIYNVGYGINTNVINFQIGGGDSQIYNDSGVNNMVLRTGPSGGYNYYVFDAAGTLSLGTIVASNWLRTTGNTGWYSNTYGGGWFMQDSTYIRNYGGKQLFLNARLRMECGTTNYIEFYDTDWGIRYIHNNDGNLGFLNSGGGWAFCNQNDGAGLFPGNVVAYWSDKRLKKNIESKDSVGDIIDKFRVVTYDWDKEALDYYRVPIEAKVNQVGLIAQEAKAVFPDAVQVNSSVGKLTEQQIKDGLDERVPADDPLLTINWDAITPLLLKEVQELRKRVAELEAKLA